MSSQAVIVSFYDGFRTERYVYFASMSMLFYDFALTFGREVDMFWRKKFTGASALFFFIRYVTVAYEILDLVSSVFTMSDKVCNGLARSYAVMEYVRYIPFGVFSAMRAHALLKNFVVSGLILVLSLMPLVNLATLYPLGLTGIFDPAVGCEVNLARMTPDELIMFVLKYFVSISRSGLILADLILVVVTWFTLALGPARPRLHLAHNSRKSLTAIMLWNGLLYFMLLFILNVLHLSFTLTSIFGSKEPSNITLFTDPVTSILTWRFLLDLQEANQRDLKLDSDDPLHISMSQQGSLNFARVMGSIESIVVPGADEVDDDGLPSSYEISSMVAVDATSTQEPQEPDMAQTVGGSDSPSVPGPS